MKTIYETKSNGKMKQNNNDNEILLTDLINYLFRKSLHIFLVVLIFGICGVIYSLLLPNKYTSEALLVSSQSGSGSELKSLASQYGGIAALAGINLSGGESSRLEQSVELLKSWYFVEIVIVKYGWKPSLMAANYWNAELGELELDQELFDSETMSWKGIDDKNLEPSSWETFSVVEDNFIVSFDNKTGFIQVSFEHLSPQFASEFVTVMIEELNAYFKSLDVQASRSNIEFLKEKIEKTEYKEMQNVFYKMIEDQSKTLMLATANSEYLVRSIIPAKVAEVKSSPSRIIICITITFVGGTLAILYFLISFLYRESQNDHKQ
jgi:hypothetical protein